MKTYSQTHFLRSLSPRPLIILSAFLCLCYFFVLILAFPPGNQVLFVLLFLGEMFHVWQALTYLHTVSDMERLPRTLEDYYPPVDVYITVAGEELELVKETVLAAKKMRYPHFKVFILNDGYVAKKENWREMRVLAKELGVTCLTRIVPGGAKAGNINHALTMTRAPYIAIFDADHVPRPNFLTRVMPYFSDPKMGFVQTPQFYKNASLNEVTKGAWEQQELFYGPICRGKNHYGAATMCGTNMVLSRAALRDVGGMCTESIAEDFATGLFMHEKGYASYYHAEVLAEGLAPEDFLSYNKQQFRWARGALDVLFKYNLLLRRGLTLGQKIQYLASVTYFLSGIVVLFNMLLPVIFLYFGLIPLQISTMLLALVFLPYITVVLFTLSRSSGGKFTFRALSFGISGFSIQLQALASVLLRKQVAFTVTPKKGVSGNHLKLVAPHLIYIVLVASAIPFAVMREGLSASVVNNISWALFCIGIFVPFIRAAAHVTVPVPQTETEAKVGAVVVPVLQQT